MAIEGKKPAPLRLESNRRAYALERIDELRVYFGRGKPIS